MRWSVGAEPKEALLTLNFPGISTQRTTAQKTGDP